MFDVNEFSNRLFRRESFQGQGEGEHIVLLERQHPFFLLASLLIPFLILVSGVSFLGVTAIRALLGSTAAGGMLGPALIAVGLLTLGMLVWMVAAYLEWENDQYILTNRRVIAIRRVFRIYEERREAELIKVQDVTTTVPGVIAYLLGFGNVTIATAGPMSRIEFARIAHPSRMKEAIFEGQQALLEGERERRREGLRQRLGDELGYH